MREYCGWSCCCFDNSSRRFENSSYARSSGTYLNSCGCLAHRPVSIQDGSKEALPSLISRFKTIYTTEGPKALFSGVVPRTLWISAGGAVFLGVYEWAVHGLMGI